MSYQDIAVKYGTDKAQHGYMPYYEQHFKKQIARLGEDPHKILEIGCKQGASLRMWNELFPNTQLFTIDIFKEFNPPDDILELYSITGSQTDGRILQHAREKGVYDIIIDDGSHNSRDQLISFYGLVNCTFTYVVEDLHCCNDSFYRQDMTFAQTMLGQMKDNKFPFKFDLYDDKIAFIYG